MLPTHQNNFTFHFRKLTKPYEKQLRYTMDQVDGGRKADLTKLFQNTIPKILDKKKYEIGATRTLNIKCTIGMDGGG